MINSVLKLKYSYYRLKLAAETADQYNFKLDGARQQENTESLEISMILVDITAEFQKAMERTRNHAKSAFRFLGDTITLSKGG